jgi:hypothetical protein
MRVTRIDGSLSLINNKVLTSVVLSALTTIVGQLGYSMNPQFWRITAPALSSFDGRMIGQCASCTSGSCLSMFTDALSCSLIVGDRYITGSSATSLINPVLTRSVGSLNIYINSVLTRVEFASLSYFGGFLSINDNHALTLVSLPRLSQVQREIHFCQNGPTFLIPSPAFGTAAPPGLTSMEFTATRNCYFQQGSGACSPYDICP